MTLKYQSNSEEVNRKKKIFFCLQIFFFLANLFRFFLVVLLLLLLLLRQFFFASLRFCAKTRSNFVRSHPLTQIRACVFYTHSHNHSFFVSSEREFLFYWVIYLNLKNWIYIYIFFLELLQFVIYWSCLEETRNEWRIKNAMFIQQNLIVSRAICSHLAEQKSIKFLLFCGFFLLLLLQLKSRQQRTATSKKKH